MVVEGAGDERRTDVKGTRERGDAEVEAAKAALRRLTGADGPAVIDRAAAAVEDLSAAAAFVEEVGLDELARAVEGVDDPVMRARGERALRELRRFRAAAVGDPTSNHFRCGHDTDLRDPGETPTE